MKCKNNEVLFCITDDPQFMDSPASGGFYVFVTPETYWNQQQCQYDQYIENALLQKHFIDTMECTLEPLDSKMTMAGAEAMLLSAGFKQDAGFSAFIDPRGSVKAPAPTGPKLDSGSIKQSICDYIFANPGCVKALFDKVDRGDIDEVELQTPKVWKREYKGQHGGGILRVFSPTCSKQGDVAEQVKVHVVTNAVDTVIKSITFEG